MEREETGKDWKKRDLQKLQALNKKSNLKRASQVLCLSRGNFSSQGDKRIAGKAPLTHVLESSIFDGI